MEQMQSQEFVATENLSFEKIIVAVHGIGDQQQFSTMQLVVSWFCRMNSEPIAIPLGRFFTDAEQKAFFLPEPFPQETFGKLGFGEVYWAKIPQSFKKERSLEETKAWAKTIVERLRLRWKLAKYTYGQSEPDCKNSDFDQAQLVLSEMIETVRILERIFQLAEKAGLFTFDFRDLLDEYLGDVQVVTEFRSGREQILATFTSLLTSVHEAHPNAEIYLVAHSEGTVVSLLGLLQAIQEQNSEKRKWLHQVKGFMTIGSPIDKHLALWPELFELKEEVEVKLSKPIKWYNYYDFSDPIGFELTGARNFINENNLKSVFDFNPENDFGFYRYYLPGQAHNDYWKDKEVFGHFIAHVINGADASTIGQFSKPASKIDVKLVSTMLPYLGAGLLLFGAAYILFKSLFPFLSLPETLLTGKLLIGSTLLIAGVTVATRIPRLTRKNKYRVRYVSIVYLFCTLGAILLIDIGLLKDYRQIIYMPDRSENPLFYFPLYVLASLMVTVVLYFISNYRPQWGAKPLILVGGVSLVTVIVSVIARTGWPEKPLWPVLLATAGALYGWWLAALVFDLSFVWHIYIRSSLAIKQIKRMVGQNPI